MDFRQPRARVLATALATILASPLTLHSAAQAAQAAQAPQGRLAAAKALRCTFQRNATGSWTKAGAPQAVLKPATLVLRFDEINFDEGTAQLRTGSVANEVVAKMAEGYVHLMQIFRTGPLYTTTVFDKDAGGKLKAVHSRHEYFAVPLPGATSSPEQYYGECEVTK